MASAAQADQGRLGAQSQPMCQQDTRIRVACVSPRSVEVGAGVAGAARGSAVRA